MMQDRWPPDPPRQEPRRNEKRPGKRLIVTVLVFMMFTVLVGFVGWVLAYPTAYLRSDRGPEALVCVASVPAPEMTNGRRMHPAAVALR